ncbi:hypothetical protein DQQ10_20495 [Pseudochryseolinea flava]|uniref:Uncharacterized protein n=1 Tax=Pseudochryseolinea flava TaxID=2059302 RepID=A0A364XYD4_9BACT|nr:hypothetical protein DQQ10_20495 [Pseudochryseolinea flava]
MRVKFPLLVVSRTLFAIIIIISLVVVYFVLMSSPATKGVSKLDLANAAIVLSSLALGKGIVDFLLKFVLSEYSGNHLTHLIRIPGIVCPG